MIPPSKQKITYSPESIKISFVLEENLFNSLQTQSPALVARGRAELMPENTKNKFVALSNAPGVGFEPTTNALTARCATAALPGNTEIYDFKFSISDLLLNIK